MYCYPKQTQFEKENTCFSMIDLITIAKAYNKWSSDICLNKKCIKANLKFPKISIKLSKIELYNKIKEILSQLSPNEYDWIELDFMESIKNPIIKENLMFFTFKPKDTKTHNTWLNTNNINEIIVQYQEIINKENGINTFKFLGAQPSDISHITKFNFSNLKKKYKKIAIVFNNDTHKNPGSHWNSCFIDNVNNTVELFDSLGKEPNIYIKHFLVNFKRYKFKWNEKKHQKEGTSCGIYACYFIIKKLENKTFEEINREILNEDFITKFRLSITRPYS